MKQKSHRLLGQYLARKYMKGRSPLHIRAFLFGCTQPDRNPATYIKGSLRCQMLRGHNYANSKRFMEKLICRLEAKQHLNLLDCYALGKLIHYTADAFTRAHNEDFPDLLKLHRAYESRLQDWFQEYLGSCPVVTCQEEASALGMIRSAHRQYLQEPICIRKDAQWSVQVCSCLTAKLTGAV